MRPLYFLDATWADKHRSQPVLHVEADRLKEVQKPSRAVRRPSFPSSRWELQGLHRQRDQVPEPKRLEVSNCQRAQYPTFQVDAWIRQHRVPWHVVRDFQENSPRNFPLQNSALVQELLFGIVAGDVRNEQAIIEQTNRTLDYAQPTSDELRLRKQPISSWSGIHWHQRTTAAKFVVRILNSGDGYIKRAGGELCVCDWPGRREGQT